jgi:hypothetical protein
MDGIIADKCREIEYTLGMFCNEEVTKEESIRKEIRCKQIQKGLKIKYKKVKLI